MWFYIPTVVLYVVLFAVPTFASFYFSLTRWTLFETEFIGLANFKQFFTEPMLFKGFINTFVYGFVTSGAKVVLGLALGMLLTSTILGRGYLRSTIFFPVLVSTVGVGVTFKVLMDPFDGLINETLRLVGINGPGWLTDPAWALMSIAMVDVWKGIGIATLIFIAGLVAIPQEYYEAARVDGATAWQRFVKITLPLLRPSLQTALIVRVVLAFVLSGTALASTGIWCAWPIGWTVATVISILFYRKGEWNTVPEEVGEALAAESASV